MPTNEPKSPAVKKPKATTTDAVVAAKPAKAVAPAKAAPAAATAGKSKIAARKPASGPTVTVRQVHSGAGRGKTQAGTLIGLGLGVPHRTRTLEDTPAVRGMIARVKHLVVVEGETKTGTR